MSALQPRQKAERQPLSPPDRKCIFIKRDFTTGLTVKFCTNFPADLVGLVDERVWTSFVKELNARFALAEKITRRSVMETLLGLATCYLIQPCLSSAYSEALDDIADYIEEFNEHSLRPRGLQVRNPIEHGMRVMEVSFLFTAKEVAPTTPLVAKSPTVLPRL